MSTYIPELEKEMTFLDFRILTYLECEIKLQKIVKIINFLQDNNFLVNFSILNCTTLKSESMYERQDIPSLTIDMNNETLRFKYWDGSKIYWTYHLDDLFDVLIEGRNNYALLVDKYKDMTTLLVDTLKNRYNQYINRVTYKYYPTNDVEILYEVQFKQIVEEEDLIDAFLDTIITEMQAIDIDDPKVNLDYSFRQECLPCQKAKEQKK